MRDKLGLRLPIAVIAFGLFFASLGGVLAQLPFGGPFELQDHTGQRVSDEDYRGKLMLITFGYTYCPDICPTSLGKMSNVIDLLGEDGNDVKPIFITVDPNRDSAEVLKDYVSHFHERMVGLTGTHEQVTKAVRAFRVHVRAVPEGEGALGDDYLVDHSSFFYLVDRDGKFLTLLLHGTSDEQMAEIVKKYL